MVVFIVSFSELNCEDALSQISNECGQTRVVCSRRRIFLGLSSSGTLLWTVRLGESSDVLFSSMNPDVRWEAAQPQPPFETHHSCVCYKKLRVFQGPSNGKEVYVEMDVNGEIKTDSDGFARSSEGKLHLNELKDEDEEEVLDEGGVNFMDEERPSPFSIGDHIAYLLPTVPVENQLKFVVTKIVGFQFSCPCFVKLENGHHDTILASGNVHVARFCIVTQRVRFPVRRLEEFKVNV
jgi:hypothetical protein